MIKLIKNLIFVICILMITSSNAFCYVLTSNELNQILVDKFKIETQKKLNITSNDAEIVVNVSNIPFNSLSTTQLTKPKIEITPISLVQPNTFRRITVKNSDNTIVKSFNVNVSTKILKEVLVATDTIQFNKEINPSNAKLEKTDVLKNYNKTLSGFSANLIAKRNYQKGNIILADYSGKKAEVTKNSLVDIIFLSNGIKVKIQGYTLKDGNIGDIITVRSDKYNKIYNARVNSANEVVVKI